MPKFRKKPVVIEAVQFVGGADSARAMLEFIGNDRFACWLHNPDAIAIETLEGRMIASPGDWIIKGIKGECYPCKPDIFEATYEAVEA